MKGWREEREVEEWERERMRVLYMKVSGLGK